MLFCSCLLCTTHHIPNTDPEYLFKTCGLQTRSNSLFHLLEFTSIVKYWSKRCYVQTYCINYKIPRRKNHSPKHLGQHCPAGMWLRCWGHERMGQTSWIHCVLPPWRKTGSIRKIIKAKHKVNVHTHTHTHTQATRSWKALAKTVFANRNFCLYQVHRTCTAVLQDFLYCLQRPCIIRMFFKLANNECNNWRNSVFLSYFLVWIW